jgi:aquaporin Z
MRTGWRAWAAEALAIGTFMASAMGFTVLLEHPASPVRQLLADATLRRAVMGAAMGLTAMALIYSPIGTLSGAHMNPAVTLAFVRLGRVGWRDAAAYVAAQCVGATLGTWAIATALGSLAADPAVNYAVTAPGAGGVWTAALGELTISFLTLSIVLAVSAAPRIMHLTGVVAGAVVALNILVEAPLSGMSMNPARSLGPAIVSGQFPSFWIYVFVPLAGMQLAAALHTALATPGCAKLHHPSHVRCVFCQA